MADDSIMNELLGESTVSEKVKNIRVMLNNFPHPPYADDQFVTEVLNEMLHCFIVLGYMALASSIFQDVILEKENKIKVRSCLHVIGRYRIHSTQRCVIKIFSWSVIIRIRS